METKSCLVCGKQFQRDERDSKHNWDQRKTCSPECNKIRQTEIRQNGYMRELVPCADCGNKHPRHEMEKRRSRGVTKHFCRTCYTVRQEKHVEHRQHDRMGDDTKHINWLLRTSIVSR